MGDGFEELGRRNPSLPVLSLSWYLTLQVQTSHGVGGWRGGCFGGRTGNVLITCELLKAENLTEAPQPHFCPGVPSRKARCPHRCWGVQFDSIPGA